MPVFFQDPPHRWKYTFLRPHIELMRDPGANPARHRPILFRLFSDLTFEDFFSGGTPGKPWFINLELKRTRAEAVRDETFYAHDVGQMLVESKAPVALLSPPGSGKTTLQLYTFSNCLAPGQALFDAGFVPCFVSGHRMQETLGHQIQASLGMGGYDVGTIDRHLSNSSRLLFLFDLNRVPYHLQHRFAQRITDELAASETFRAKGHRLILAARNRPELANYLFSSDYDLWSIQPLPREQVRDFLYDTLHDIRLSPAQRELLDRLLAEHGELLRNPFHLSLITILLSRDPQSLAELNSTGKLFKLVTERILAQELPNWAPLENAQGPSAPPLEADPLRASALRSPPRLERRVHPGDLLLQQIARHMTEQGVRSLDVAKELPDLLHALHGKYHGTPWWPRRDGQAMSDAELEPLLNEHSLFRISPEGTHMLWLHDIFQDFYASKSLAFDPETGRPRVELFESTASVDPKLIELLEDYSKNPRWFEVLPFLTDLLEPRQFEQLVKEWCLAKFQRNDRKQLVPRPGQEPNRFILKHIVNYLEALGWTNELDDLIQLPFLRAKIERLGYESIVPDLEARVRYSLENYWASGQPERLFEALIQLAVGRSVVFEETEGGAILRDFLDNKADFQTTKRRIEALDDALLRFFHLLLLAEAVLRRERPHGSHDADMATIEDVDQVVKEAMQLPISPAQMLHQQDQWLRRYLLDCWAMLHTVGLDLDSFLLLFSKLNLTRKAIIDTLRGILKHGQRTRVRQLIERIAPTVDERRYYKGVLKDLVASYAQDWLWGEAMRVVNEAPANQRDELLGAIVETAIAGANFDKARELVEKIHNGKLQKHLRQQLAGGGKTKKPSACDDDDDRDTDTDTDTAEGAAGGHIGCRGEEKDPPTAPTLSFFVKRRTDLLEAFGDHAALKLRPPGSRSRRRMPIFGPMEKVAIYSRWGYYWWTRNDHGESEKCFRQAKHFMRQIGPGPEEWLFPSFELYRHLRLAEDDDAEAVFAQLMGNVQAEREAAANSPLPWVLAEQCSYWGFLDAAEMARQPTHRETWQFHGRFFAHYMRHLLAHQSPEVAFAWFGEQPMALWTSDPRWREWVDTCTALSEAWSALKAGQLTKCLQLFDEIRASIEGFQTDRELSDRELDPYLTYFRGQMLANLVLTCFHHVDLRPVGEREILAMRSAPMRTFCVGHYLRFRRDGVPEELIDSALAALPQFDKRYFDGKIRVVKNWAEAIAELPEAAYRPWLGRFLKEISTDPRLIRYILPDLAWALTQRETDTKSRKSSLHRLVEIFDDADTLARRYG